MEIIQLPQHRIAIPSSICISGPSFSGKTYWLFHLLKHKDVMFSQKPMAVIYCYKEYNALFEKVQISGLNFFYGLPTMTQLRGWLDKFERNCFILIFDDLMSELSTSEIAIPLSTAIVHHSNICCIYTDQNIFFQGRTNRTVSLNQSYFVLMRTCRDRCQIQVLGSQILGAGNSKAFVEAYSDAVDSAQINSVNTLPYLLVSCHPVETRRDCQLTTNIFPDDQYMIIYRV